MIKALLFIAAAFLVAVFVVGAYAIGRWWGFAQGYNKGVTNVATDLSRLMQIKYYMVGLLKDRNYWMRYKSDEARVQWLRQVITAVESNLRNTSDNSTLHQEEYQAAEQMEESEDDDDESGAAPI